MDPSDFPPFGGGTGVTMGQLRNNAPGGPSGVYSSEIVNMLGGGKNGLDGGGIGAQGGPSFDLSSDFPALATRVAGMSLQEGGGPDLQVGRGSGPGGSAEIGPSLAGPGHYSMHAGSHRQASDFAIQTEDFPALPGFSAKPNGVGGVPDLHGSSGGDFPSLGAQRTGGQSTLMHSAAPGRPTSAGSSVGGGGGGVVGFAPRNGDGIRGLALQDGGSASRAPGGLGATSASHGAASSAGQYSVASNVSEAEQQFGLLGLLGVIRPDDLNVDRGTLALGTDLTTLGLSLNSSERLYSTFGSPWATTPTPVRELDFSIPACYQQVPPRQGGAGGCDPSHFAKFQLETLFYIFFAMPRDQLQAHAAKELYQREWSFHGDLKLWLTRKKPQDTTAASGWIYFDINSWERRVYTGQTVGIEQGFIPKESIVLK